MNVNNLVKRLRPAALLILVVGTSFACNIGPVAVSLTTPTPVATLTPVATPTSAPTSTSVPTSTPTPRPLSNYELRREIVALRQVIDADWTTATNLSLYPLNNSQQLEQTLERIISNSEAYNEALGSISYTYGDIYGDERQREWDEMCIQATRHSIRSAECFLEHTRSGDPAWLAEGLREQAETNALWDRAWILYNLLPPNLQ